MEFLYFVLTAIGILGIGAIIRAILGPTIWDRMLAMNLISSKIIMAIVIFAVIINKSYLLDIAIVYALLGFIGVILIARFIERRGDIS